MGRAIEHISFYCLVGDHEGKAAADYRVGRDGRPQWFIGCFGCPPEGYLRALAEEVGAPSGAHIKENPLRWLGDLVRPPRPRLRPAPLPAADEVARHVRRLKRSSAALDYLREQKGLNLETIRRAQLGYDGEAFTIPVSRPDGTLANYKRRFWPDPHPVKMAGLPGRRKEHGAFQLYPDLPVGRRVWLCAGEWDALLGRQHGLPTVTGTGGVNVWMREWGRALRGRHVAVIFDVGEERQADQRARSLCAAGAEAWPVYLRELGLGDKEDLSDFLLRHGGSRTVLRLLVREAERARKRLAA